MHFNSCSPAPGVLRLVLGHLHTLPRAAQSPELLRERVQGLVWEGRAQDGVLPSFFSTHILAFLLLDQHQLQLLCPSYMNFSHC